MKKCLLVLSGFLMAAGMLIAQPVNDNCAGALPINYAATEAEVVLTNGDSRGGTGDATVPNVCSGTWFNDDVWFILTTPADLPPTGIVVKTYFGTEQTDVTSVGMAFYHSCDADGSPVQCFSSDDPTMNTLEISSPCLEANTTYLIRVWSGGPDIPGTFRIGAFASGGSDNILWQETFGDGLTGWTTMGTCGGDASLNENAVWKYYPDGVIDDGAYANVGVGVLAPSVCDGAVGVDSDFDDTNGVDGAFGTGPCPVGTGSQYILMSPVIDHSEWGVAGISIAFRQGLREFQSTYFVGYRIYENGAWAEWRNYEINTDDEYPVNSNHFSNEAVRVFMGGAQAGDSLQIRLVYNANFYYWGVDDIRLIEAPCVDMRSQSNWYAIAPAVTTPVNQVRPWFPLNDVYNGGACTQNNVMLNFSVSGTKAGVVYNQDLPYNSIEADVLVENVNFPTPVVLSSNVPQTYTGTYTVTSDQSTPENDFNFDDNSNTFQFSTTAGSAAEYALETGSTRLVAVNTALYDPNAPWSYTYGNYFYITNSENEKGEKIRLVHVLWGVGNPADVAGIPINLILYEWTDVNDNEIAESSERTIIAFGSHEFNGSEPENTILETPLESFTGGEIEFKDNQAYLLVAEYNAIGQTTFFLMSSEAYDYGGVVLSSAQAGTPTYASVLGFSPDGNVQGIDYEVTELDVNDDRIFFGWDIVPLIRMVLDIGTAVDNTLPEDNIVKLYPNPASEKVTLELEFTQRMENVSVMMVDVTGKTVHTQSYKDMDRAQFEYLVEKLAPGTYTLRVGTELGSRTVPFIVQR